MRLDQRLKRLEATSAVETERVITFIPDDGSTGESREVIRAKWNRYLATGEAENNIVILPDGVTLGSPGDGDTPGVCYDEDWYGNMDLMRERIAQRLGEIEAGRRIPEPWENPIEWRNEIEKRKEIELRREIAARARAAQADGPRPEHPTESEQSERPE